MARTTAPSRPLPGGLGVGAGVSVDASVHVYSGAESGESGVRVQVTWCVTPRLSVHV